MTYCYVRYIMVFFDKITLVLSTIIPLLTLSCCCGIDSSYLYYPYYPLRQILRITDNQRYLLFYFEQKKKTSIKFMYQLYWDVSKFFYPKLIVYISIHKMQELARYHKSSTIYVFTLLRNVVGGNESRSQLCAAPSTGLTVESIGLRVSIFLYIWYTRPDTTNK